MTLKRCKTVVFNDFNYLISLCPICFILKKNVNYAPNSVKHNIGFHFLQDPTGLEYYVTSEIQNIDLVLTGPEFSVSGCIFHCSD